MRLEPTTAEDIAAACADLNARGPFPAAIAEGLGGNDPDRMRAAVTHLLDAGRVDGLRALVERFRGKADFGVWARVTSARLHHIAGEYAQALADIDDLMARFPKRAGAHWWVAQARALEGLGRQAEAEAAIRDGAQRFPEAALPRVYLANLLSRARRPAEAVDVWRDLIARFAEPEPDWFVGLAHALKALQRPEEAWAALEAGAQKFAGDRRAPPLIARVAEERNDWPRALEAWTGYAERFAAQDEPQALIGRGRALYRLGQVDEGIALLDELLAREPNHAAGLRERALIATELGEAARARDDLLRLTRRHAGVSRPDWWAALARAHHDLRDYDAGAAALAELERRFPDSALAEGERLRLAKEQEHGHEELQARIEAALKRFPEDANLRSHRVWILLSLGRLDEAEAQTAALEREAAPGHALAARLRLEADRGDASLRAFCERFAEARAWDVADAIQIVNALIDVRAPWAFDLGLAIAEEAGRRFAGNVRLNHLHIRLLIARREDDAALAMIDATPRRYIRREYLELRAWAEAKRGRHAEAKALWAEAIATAYYAACDAPIHRLTRVSPDDRPGPQAGVTAYVVLRNEAAQIPGFLAHHRRLGVRRFVFFDHASSDASRALALSEPDVIVYDCPDSYQLSWSGRRWVNEIVARENARGWGLQLDMDEHLIFPGCETVGLDRLIAYLDARGFEGVRGYMFDLFPQRLIGEDGAPAPFSDYRYYDDDYYLMGLERPPYLHPGGGVRARLFEAKEFLHKTPLWRLDAGKLINSHETTHLKFADVSAALLHYKMMNVALRGRGAARAGAAFLEADADVEAIRRHARYAARLAPLWRADLREPGLSRELEDSFALSRRGLMDASEDYLAFVRGR